MKKKEKIDPFTRVALYIRVSREEQKIKGLSLEAQQERLEAYAREQGWIIVGTYIDAAKTARKNIHKRAEFGRMIEAVQRDEIDLLLFCRLDRWFRSVADYYKITEILQAHGCDWKTIDEDYDTTTANGRLYINVKLSIAQNEADIGGERISVVFDSKIAHGTVVSGSCSFGYRINKEKRLEIVPGKAVIVQDAFNHFEETVSQVATAKYIRETYGVTWALNTFRRMLSDKLYIGVYDRKGRLNENFCPAIIEKEQFERVQILLKRNVRHAPTGRVYIFTSLIVCAECKHKMVGRVAHIHDRIYYYYRCNQHFQRGACSHKKEITEGKIEKWLFTHLGEELEKVKLEWKMKAAAKKQEIMHTEKAALKRKLTKLKELYVNDLINMEEYKKDYEIYTTALQNIPEPAAEIPPDFSSAEAICASGFRETYDTLSKEEKRTLWRTALKEILIDAENNIIGITFG